MKSFLQTTVLTLALLSMAIFASVAPVDTATAQVTTDEIQITQTAEIPVIEDPDFLIVPKLEAATIVENVGVNESGEMGVPDDWRNSAWYERGFSPGERGHAVFAAHRDWSGNEGPFYNLPTMEAGDMIYVANTAGTILAYEVTESTLYDRFASPQGAVFGAAIVPSVSLVTCEGDFLDSDETYTDRRVVQGELAFSVENGQVVTY